MWHPSASHIEVKGNELKLVQCALMHSVDYNNLAQQGVMGPFVCLDSSMLLRAHHNIVVLMLTASI